MLTLAQQRTLTNYRFYRVLRRRDDRAVVATVQPNTMPFMVTVQADGTATIGAAF